MNSTSQIRNRNLTLKKLCRYLKEMAEDTLSWLEFVVKKENQNKTEKISSALILMCLTFLA
jgi:hypothetical protein